MTANNEQNEIFLDFRKENKDHTLEPVKSGCTWLPFILLILTQL
jgi:hypothetical protein